MKKSTLIFLISALLFSAVSQSQSLPYKAAYSSNFKMGTHELSKIILTLYKDYESNDLVTHASWFADTVTVLLPDGHMIRGKDEALKAFKEDREKVTNATFNMDAIIPLVSVDRKENWVALWGSQESSAGKGDFQAIWRLNKDNKVDFIKFFNAQSQQQ
jgi:hypothetical protein